jgi:L-amino acid N-acyltransferase YncA
VLEHNLSSLRLFKACGFTEAGTVARGGDRAILLELAGRRPGDQGS